MAFKTAAEMFGDGGGFGAAVPYSTTNPPGTGAGNRGIQFGEQLTAAIANRTHYALALNDEDLNTRLAAFETGGLNGAYDNGTVGPAGGGRDITKDAGALETVSAHAAVYGDTARDNAHVRANAIGDTVASSIGFDFLAKRVGASGQSGNDAVAGMLDRRVVAKATGLTQLTDANAATLNPGGALPTTVRLTVGQIHSGGETDLFLDIDLVEVTGSGTADGLYVLRALGGLTTDATLQNLDGSTPALPANQACTVAVYRPTFGTFGSYAGRSGLKGTLMAGMPDGRTALSLIGGRNQTDTTGGGAGDALSIISRAADGSMLAPAWIDFLGRMHFDLRRADVIDEADRNADLGNYATIKEHSEEPGVGHIVKGATGLQLTYDFLSLIGASPPTSPAISGATMAFTANSPITGELLFNAPQDADLGDYLFGVGMFVELSGAGTADGLYIVNENIVTGNQGFLLSKADGDVPAHFPAAGTCTLTAVYTSSCIGRITPFSNTNALDGVSFTATSYNVLSGGIDSDAVGLALFMPNNADGGSRAFLRMFRANPDVNSGIEECFAFEADGNVRARGALYVGNDFSAASQGVVIATTQSTAEFRYETPRTREILVSLEDGVAYGSSPGWTYGGVTNPLAAGARYWASTDDLKYLVFPLNAYLRDGMVITDVEVLTDPGNARVGSPFAMQLLLGYTAPNLAVPAVPGAGTTVASADQANSTAVQTISLSSGLGVGHTVVREGSSGRDYMAIIYSGSDGGHVSNRVYALRLTVTDPGPRNF